MKLFTIGTSKKSAEQLFNLLKRNNVKKVIDVRLKNANSYCFYTFKRDFPFLLSLVIIGYEHKVNWAPEAWLLDGEREGKYTWEQYEIEFNKIIENRNILKDIKAEDLDNCVLLCSEPTPEKCHRRLLAEYFKKAFSELEIIHI